MKSRADENALFSLSSDGRILWQTKKRIATATLLQPWGTFFPTIQAYAFHLIRWKDHTGASHELVPNVYGAVFPKPLEG